MHFFFLNTKKSEFGKKISSNWEIMCNLGCIATTILDWLRQSQSAKPAQISKLRGGNEF